MCIGTHAKIRRKLLGKKGLHIPDDREEEDQSDEEDSNSSDAPFRFKASPGWLQDFKKRSNVTILKMKGEKGSADYEAVDK